MIEIIEKLPILVVLRMDKITIFKLFVEMDRNHLLKLIPIECLILANILTVTILMQDLARQ